MNKISLSKLVPILLALIIILILPSQETTIEETPTLSVEPLTLVNESKPELIQNRIYIPDSYNSRVQVFDLQGNNITSFGNFGSGNYSFKMPSDVIEIDEKIYVLDKGNNRIQVFDKNLTFLFSFGKTFLLWPLGFEEYNGTIYVANTYKSKITSFYLNGTNKSSFGKRGMGQGQFRYISDVVLDDNFIYVLDTDNNKIKVFYHNETFKFEWGSYSLNESGLRFPMGIELYNQTIYISDSINGRIKMYFTNGTEKNSFGEYGRGDEQFMFNSKMWQINGVIYIADTLNNRIKVYSTNGTLLNMFGSFGGDNGQFRAPGALRKFGVNSLINKTVNTTTVDTNSSE
ncbi:hypothetical protein HOF78_03070 [Candidatus Woesearchaeota archaeon]|jgi:tripartite motif-containing protein 71|nr:hypothetical protein [Candidatus Woesearchaeota archaeon]MBT6044827.1 hypothetical protein [Candidatus Woesearchaeota archaeon]